MFKRLYTLSNAVSFVEYLSLKSLCSVESNVLPKLNIARNFQGRIQEFALGAVPLLFFFLEVRGVGSAVSSRSGVRGRSVGHKPAGHKPAGHEPAIGGSQARQRWVKSPPPDTRLTGRLVHKISNYLQGSLRLSQCLVHKTVSACV